MLNKRVRGLLFIQLLMLGLLMSGLSLEPARTSQAADDTTCQTFQETTFKICGRFLEYWTANGGLAQEGLPISDVFAEKNAAPPAGDGQTHQVQYFQRARFEAHTENTAPYDVLLGLLGTEQYSAKYAQKPELVQQAGPCQHFDETNQDVCGRFLEYWRANGGLTQQGLPISGVLNEQNAPPPAGDGKVHQVQYFQRARFEAHSENAAPYDVLLGLLGTEQYNTKYNAPAPTPTPTPAPTATPTAKPSGCSSVPANVNAGTLVPCGPAGMEVLIGAAMGKDEDVAITPIAPDGVRFAPLTVHSNKDDGQLNAHIATRPDFPRGVWTFQLVGKTSHKTGTAYVYLSDAVTKPTIIIQPNPAHMSDNIAIISVGWPADQHLRLNLTPPDTSKGFFEQELNANEGGAFTISLTINRDIPTELRMTGRWLWTETTTKGDYSFITAPMDIIK